MHSTSFVVVKLPQCHNGMRVPVSLPTADSVLTRKPCMPSMLQARKPTPWTTFSTVICLVLFFFMAGAFARSVVRNPVSNAAGAIPLLLTPLFSFLRSGLQPTTSFASLLFKSNARAG